LIDNSNIEQKQAAEMSAKTAAPAPPEAVLAAENPEKKEFVSTGWKVHNELTYRVIDWLVNSSVGVAFAYWSSRTPTGEKYFQKPVSNVFKKILAPALKNDVAAINEGAKWGTMFTGIMAGGFTIIPPMMAMENKNNKKKIVRAIDEKIYGKDAVENDPKFAECYENIEEEPKMGLGIGLASRVLAILPIIALATIPATNKPLIKYIYDPIAKASKWTAKKIGIKPSKDMLDPLKGAMEHLDGDPKSPRQMQSNWDFLHRMIGFDFGLTLVYAVLHEAAYKGLAAIGVKKTDEPTTNKTLTAVREAAAYDPLLPMEDKNMENEYQSYSKGGFQDKIKARAKIIAPEATHTQKLRAEPEAVATQSV
jgi:hypothetical protein